MDKPIIAQNAAPVNGPVLDQEAGEWRVYLDGQSFTWASNEPAGWAMYNQARATMYGHYTRQQNRADLVQYVA